MKLTKLSFKEAYEANKTQKIRIVKPEGFCGFIVGEMHEEFCHYVPLKVALAEFEVVREPRVIWVNEYPNGGQFSWATKEEADVFAASDRIACRKFVEVIDDKEESV